jgi:hypothetical protein
MALQRTTVHLDENDLRDLKLAAARRSVSKAEFRTVRPLTEDKTFRVLPDDS